MTVSPIPILELERVTPKARCGKSGLEGSVFHRRGMEDWNLFA